MGTPKTPTPGKGGYGMPCTSPQQCQSSICAHDLTLQQQYCTQACNPQAPACPVDSECLSASGGTWICAPGIDTGVDGEGGSPGFSTGGGMSCAVTVSDDADAAPDPLLGLLALLLLLGVHARRRLSR
jgi:MYXO-CTERM domain-containing protein